MFAQCIGQHLCFTDCSVTLQVFSVYWTAFEFYKAEAGAEEAGGKEAELQAMSSLDVGDRGQEGPRSPPY
jgi:hypothetical protein